MYGISPIRLIEIIMKKSGLIKDERPLSLIVNVRINCLTIIE
jgi:hypothetical protein